MKNIVIVGASHAAVEAISSLRKAGWVDKITLIGDEDVLPYQRPPLSKGYYKNDVLLEKLAIKKPEYYDNANVDVILGQRVETVDRINNEVVLGNGTKIFYTKLILSTGTRARKLSIEGVGDDIKYLRTISDVDEIKKQIPLNGNLLIVGAGYIGLELAASAVKQGISVTVLEAQDRVLERVTSPVISEFYQQAHRAEGVDIRLGVSLASFAGDLGDRYAVLSSGEKIPFDCAVVGIGVIPNVELAEQAGLECDNGIVVDGFTQTSDQDIYAIGDCSNHPSIMYQRRLRLESVPNAVAQAKTAAMSICGEDIIYNQLPWFWSDQYDLKLQTAGLMQGYDRLEVDGDVDARKFSVSYFKGDQLIALDAINAPAQFMKAKKRLTLELSEKAS